MDVEADVLVAHQRRLASVQTDADAELPTLRPGLLAERALGRSRRVAGIDRALEDAEERIAFGPQLAPLVAAEGVAQDLVVLHLQRHVIGAELAHEARRAFDVREQECDSPGRE